MAQPHLLFVYLQNEDKNEDNQSCFLPLSVQSDSSIKRDFLTGKAIRMAERGLY